MLRSPSISGRVKAVLGANNPVPKYLSNKQELKSFFSLSALTAVIHNRKQKKLPAQ